MRILLLFAAMMAFATSGFTQCASPVLTYNSHSLCQGDPADLYLVAQIALPAGCAFRTPNSPYDWVGPNTNTSGISLANHFNITANDLVPGPYKVRVELIDDPNSTIACPCLGLQISNIITVRPKPIPPTTTVLEDGCVGQGAIVQGIHPPPAPTSSPIFYWYNASLSTLLHTGDIFNTPSLTTGVNSYAVRQSVAGCVSDYTPFTLLSQTVALPAVQRDTISIMCNNSTTLSATPAPSTTLKWYDTQNMQSLLGVGNTFNTPVLNNSTSYWVVASSGNCNSIAKEVYVRVRQSLPPVTTSSINVCQGAPIQLSASHNSAANTPNGFMEWYDANNGSLLYVGNPFAMPNSLVSAAGPYYFKVRENVEGCRSNTSDVTVNVIGLPASIPFSATQQVCEGGSITLTPSAISSTYTYDWSGPDNFGSSLQSPIVNNISIGENEGFYELRVRDVNTGCVSPSSREYVDIAAKPTTNLMPTLSVPNGNSVQLSVGGGTQYEWWPEDNLSAVNIPNPIFTSSPLANGSSVDYVRYVRVTDTRTTCSAVDSIVITVQPSSDNKLDIHDILTPNGDGFNDMWDIDYIYQYNDVTIKVLDMYGRVVYYFKDASGGNYDAQKWNARYNNDGNDIVVPDGTYMYLIEAKSPEAKVFSGSITVINPEK